MSTPATAGLWPPLTYGCKAPLPALGHGRLPGCCRNNRIRVSVCLPCGRALHHGMADKNVHPTMCAGPRQAPAAASFLLPSRSGSGRCRPKCCSKLWLLWRRHLCRRPNRVAWSGAVSEQSSLGRAHNARCNSRDSHYRAPSRGERPKVTDWLVHMYDRHSRFPAACTHYTLSLVFETRLSKIAGNLTSTPK